MNKKRFGCIQGRLSTPPKKNMLQYFPKNWEAEFIIVKKLNIFFIEYFKDRNKNILNNLNSISTAKKLEDVRTFYKIENYSICDDFFINNNILSYRNFSKYFNNLIKIMKLLKIKIYVLPLFGKSNLTEKNYLNYTKIISLISESLKKEKILLALETNLNCKFFFKFLNSLNNSGNTFLVYDTGNRLKKNNDPYKEICGFGGKIIHVHLKDKNFQGENVIIGTGKVNFSRIFQGLKKIDYKKKFVFETNRGLNPVLTMIHNLLYIDKICKSEKYKL